MHFGVEHPVGLEGRTSPRSTCRRTLGGGPLRELATAAVGGVFHLLGVLAEMLLDPGVLVLLPRRLAEPAAVASIT